MLYTREAKASLPSDKNDLAIIYTTPEEGDVYYSDTAYVALSGSTSNYLLHQYKKQNDNRHDRIKVRIDLKSSYAPTSSTVYLQIWNGITNSWETLDSNATYAADTEFSLYGDVTETSYYDFRESFAEVAFRVYQYNNSGSTKILSVDLVQISFLIVYQADYIEQDLSYTDEYVPVGNKYADEYTIRANTWQQRYPHKNTQDDDYYNKNS